jgi:hypothetical protein
MEITISIVTLAKNKMGLSFYTSTTVILNSRIKLVKAKPFDMFFINDIKFNFKEEVIKAIGDIILQASGSTTKFERIWYHILKEAITSQDLSTFSSY